MENKIYSVVKKGNEAREAIFKGMTEVKDVVAPTIGAAGRNAVYKDIGPTVTNDGVSIARRIHPKDEFERLGADMIKETAEETNKEAGDGPQPLYSRVLTPDGFKKMGDIKIGDKVCGTNGSIQNVLGVFPKGEKKIYKVKFSDGRVVECCEDHLWDVRTHWGLRMTLTVQQMLEKGIVKETGENKQYQFYTPRSNAEFTKKELPLDPYLVGVLIGDGSLSMSDSTEISLGINKEHILDQLIFPKGISMNVSLIEDKNYFRVKIVGHTENGETIRDFLKEIGLQGTTSKTKFIPPLYLYSDTKDREALLRGLADTDGYTSERGLLEYSTVSKELHDGILELLRGLGRAAFSYLRERNGDSYSDTPLYRISELKGYKYGDKIVNIEKTDKTTQMQCIKVSNPDNLYFTEDYILTHNTSTSIILAHALIEAALEEVKTKNPMLVRRELDKAKEEVLGLLKESSKEIKTDKEILDVAKISVEDNKLAEIIADTIKESGENGTVIVEEGTGYVVEKDVVKGYFWDRGYVSPYFVTNEKMESVLEDVTVIVTDRYMNRNLELIGAVNELHQKGAKSFLIIADKMEGELLQTLITNQLKGIIKVCAVVRPPADEELEDIAAITGATALTREKGIRQIKAEHAGKAKKVIATRERVIIVTDDSMPTQQFRIESLQKEVENEKDEDKLKFLKERLSKLTDGMAVLRIGARTETERKYLSLKVEDAVNAVISAKKEGIVKGGGVALYEIAGKVKNTLLQKALQKPYLQILENAGIDPTKKISGDGYDVLTGEVVKDMFKAGIIDPTRVERCAVENAISLAGTVLTLETVVAHLREVEPGFVVSSQD